MSTSNVFQILSNLRQQAIASNERGGRLVTHSSTSRGMGFIINGERFFCDADLVREVAVPQDLIPVPQSKAWMRGVLNSKGVLFSVVDLGMLGGLDRPVVYQRGHLMILRDASRQCSLLVNRVIGFRNFDFTDVDQRESDAQTNDQWWESLSAFMGKSVHEGGEAWRYIDIQKLIDSEVFLEVQ